MLIVPSTTDPAASLGYRLRRKMKGKAWDLLFEDERLHEYRIACPVCGRSRHVQRTDFWRLPRHPRVYMLLRRGKFNNATSFLRTMPDFLIIGIAKSGTTSLYGLVNEHPQVVPARIKEVHFFTDVRNYVQGGLSYRSRFPSAPYKYCLAKRHGHKILSGEASSTYMFHPMVPGRVRAALPDVKMIAILRNPVDRAYSEYHMQIREQHESLTFEDAIKAEKARISYEMKKASSDPRFRWHNLHAYSYLSKGHYAEQLARWFRYYDRDRFLVLTLEELKADRQGVLDRVFAFLGLEPFDAKNIKTLPNSFWIKQFRADLPDASSPGLLNVGRYHGMNPDTRRMLIDYFRPHNERLSELLQRDFDWDR